ncbi:hypothetical protein [Ramlibacter sp.]|uniref:hypothetical protein n=1 Tax=Ramlibacter sp. TaxID=1917967 RepID=UPI003D132D9B
MDDLGITARRADAAEEESMGTLRLDQASKESLEGFNQRMLEATKLMREKLGRAADRVREDPVFIEHRAQGDKA